ncbi:50S ribosomal protein L24 [candidate division Kazan bacterium RBG_13_50_9]|uniref:Large ribosomal subunit protein uL24 n=1 Tax=candidate division Kazan bacterium RBG_13_50_9 TaxID=1798535 RepID=A0A1F4NSY0_UNCK3|nr:MAG: 50S ribosomal protein L24 [candidate division Kazan bacterium RBG_13_50_9]
MKIKKGDLVLVIKGKDRGKTGKVVSVNRAAGTVKIGGINVAKKHIRAGRGRGKSGGIVEVALPVDAAKVMFICPHCGNKPVKLGYKITKSGSKERICRVCRSTV